MNDGNILFGTAAILAGGKSTRMGFDKQLLTDKDHRVLELVSSALKSEFSDILIVTAKPELYSNMNVRTCSDEYKGKGPLAGIQAALKNAQSQYVYLIACDMPVICLPYIRHMKTKILSSRAQICLTRKNDRFEPFNAFYSKTLVADVTSRLENGSTSLFHFINDSMPYVISEKEAGEYDRDLRMFTNINTQSEYEIYLRKNVLTGTGEY